jgi:hypothetical protein
MGDVRGEGKADAIVGRGQSQGKKKAEMFARVEIR